jgi:signal transduction histidine kinase
MRLGDERMVVAVVRDATTRKLGEDQMRHAKEVAEEANRAKSEFLAHISHELRTPLNAVMGFAELFQSEAFGALGNEKYKEYATHIYGSGRHLLELINDILELSRAEAGKLTLAESDFEMPGVLVAALEMVRKDATESGIELETEIERTLPKLRGDERRVRQVAINLLSNAVKFTPKGGRITVRADLDEEGGHRLAVSDTGVGIAEDDIERALKPFVQVDSTLTRRYIGAGLGLPLSQRLVELHGGTLEIESALGSGTTVTARFPAGRTVEDNTDRRDVAGP